MGAVKKIHTPEQLRELVSYDPETGLLTWKPRKSLRFNNKSAGKPAFNAISKGYRAGRTGGRFFYRAHRVAWAVYYGRWPDGQIDHINGDGLDNRIVNLREVTPVVNGQNRKLSVNNKTGVNGVRARNGKFTAALRCNGKTNHLGTFNTLEEASSAVKKAAREFGFHENHGRKDTPTTPVDGVGAENERAPLSCRLKGPVNIEDAATIDAIENRASMLDAQIEKLAEFIMAEVPGEPSQSEGAVDTAIRWMRSALANPEAEARLRERVVELEQRLATAYRVKAEINDIANEERRERLAAEARLAQAEGGPAVTEVERGLRTLMTGEFSSLTIGFNDHHACNYVNAKGWQEQFGGYGCGEDALIEWASEEERQKAIDENSVWTIQWYPNTPVGFNCVGASTLAAALEAALHPQSATGEEGKP